jgi:hypothetical protein
MEFNNTYKSSRNGFSHTSRLYNDEINRVATNENLNIK